MKMKKLVALATAAALCLGMSLTAFAADEKELSPEEIKYGYSDDDKHFVVSEDLTAEEKEEIANAAKDALAEKFDVAGKDVVVIGVGDYTLYDKETGKPITDGKLDGKATFNFFIGSETKDGYEKGATIYVAHQKADGSWEILTGVLDRVAGEWVITVDMDSFSPVAFLKVMSNGKIVEVDKKGEPVKATTTRSPKTGE